MPLYEYECGACGQHFELIRRFSDPEVDTCTLCGKGPVRRLLSSPAIQFKGSGWYITDYARQAKTDASSTKTGDASASDTTAKRSSESASTSDTPQSSTPAPKTDTK